MKEWKKAAVSVLVFTVLVALSGFNQAVNAGESELPTVRFAVIGDRTGGHVPGIYGQVVGEIQRLRPEFVISVGDMIEGYTDDTTRLHAEWQEYMSLIEPLTMKIYHTCGNHDALNEIQESIYRQYMGPPYYSFDYEHIHFVFIDNGRYETSNDIAGEQIEWLIDDLKKTKDAGYTIVFMHRPFWYKTKAVGKPDTLHTLFVEYGVDAVFTGHYHQYFTGVYDDIIYTGVGSSGGGTEPGPSGLMYHFCWVTVSGDDIAIAPIKMGAVLPWDEVTADELRIVTRMQKFGLACEKVSVEKDLTVSEQRFIFSVNNLSPEQGFHDTLKWKLPEGWTIRPEYSPVDIAIGETGRFEFTASCAGSLYPLPSAAVDFTYREGKKATVTIPLPISREVDCPKVAKRPKIDGKLKEKIWQNPTTRLFSPDGGPMEIDPVEFYFAYDDKNLYLAARCTETVMDSLVGKVKKRDGAVWAEDCVGYFFQPDIDKEIAYQIYINPLGAVFDQKLIINQDGFVDGNIEWNGKYKIKTGRGDDYWTVEAAIPLDQFETAGEAGKKCGINFRRKQKRLGTASDWQEIDHDPKSYGTLIMR